MNLIEITDLIEHKIEQNPNKIVFSFFEMKIKLGLSDSVIEATIDLIATRLTNIGYKVYKTGETYIFQDNKYIVETNELLVGIK